MKKGELCRAVGVVFVACASAPVGASDRTIDGSGNNLLHGSMGQTGTDLLRGPAGAFYLDGLQAPMDRGNPRAISNALSNQSAAGLGNARNLSSWAWQWGQFLDHDTALVDESAEHMDIAIPAGDPVFDPSGSGTAVMPFVRSVCTGGVSGPREQANSLTHWLDGSMVYGSDSVRAGTLRAMSGGLLATSPGGLLPYNTTGLPNGPNNGAGFFIAGDVRANEQTGLLATHTLFVREHNRLAGQISAANPGWTDEEVYQRARKLVGAEIQAITYNEWLPAVLGGHAPGSYGGYNAGIDGGIATEFSTAAFRFGHTMLNDQLLRFNADGTVFSGGHLNLFQQFFNPSSITAPGALEATLRGLARQQANEVDTQAIDGVRNLLFGGTNGRDLIAVNLQRGRDHGLPDYNALRAEYGLPTLGGFSEVTSDPALAAALQTTYGTVDNIDPWIGLFAEDHLAGASFGETAAAIIVDQFTRLRDGDRFFYLNDGDLGPSDLQFLGGLRLADLIRLNTDALDVQDNVFFAVPAPASLSIVAWVGGVAMRRRRGGPWTA